MRHYIPLYIPEAFVSLKDCLDFWENDGRWDANGLDWLRIRSSFHPIRAALAEQTISASLIEENGSIHKVPFTDWVGGYLWSEAYTKSLVHVNISGIRHTGYLYLDRAEVLKLWHGRSDAQRIRVTQDHDLVTKSAEISKPLSFAFHAYLSLRDGLASKKLDQWLADNWPEGLEAYWPDRAIRVNLPSIARQIKVLSLKSTEYDFRWENIDTEDQIIFDINERSALFAVCFEVFQLGKGKALDGPGGKIRPAQVKNEIKRRLGQFPVDGPKANLLDCAARLSIPFEKVSGGGRKLRG